MSTLVPVRTHDVLDRHEPAPLPLQPCLTYLAWLVGAGLVSAGVERFAQHPSLYAAVAVIGLAVSTTAALLHEVVLAPERPDRATAARLVGSAPLIAAGFGLLLGGVQLFLDRPVEAGTLVPLGMLVAFLGYLVRSAGQRRIVVPSLAVGAAAVLTFACLQLLAAAVVSPTTGDPAVTPVTVVSNHG